MSEDVFGGPASASGVKITEFEGQLLLFWPNEYEEDIETAYGSKDAVRGRLVVLDEKTPMQSEAHDNIRLFQARLIAQTKPLVGVRPVLGRLGKGEAKKGQSEPWMLLDPSEDDKNVARAFIASQGADL